MVSILNLKNNIQKDQTKTKYLLYFNRLSQEEFYIPVKTDMDTDKEMNLLQSKPWCTRARIAIHKPKRATRR